MKNIRIAVISDTHRDLSKIRKITLIAGDVDAWFHCGDDSNDAKEIKKYSDKPIYTVQGNCDMWAQAPEKRVVEIGGKRFYLTHGHRESVKFQRESLMYAALEENCDMAIYGHTHVPNIEYGLIPILNPGSPTNPRNAARTPTFAIITIENGDIRIEIKDC